MTKRPSGKNATSTARTIIEGLFAHLGIADKIEQHRIWLIWKDCVGPQIAAQASPLRIRDNILEVRVSHPVWMQQLQLLKPRLIERINTELGETPIKDMFFRRGQPKREDAPAVEKIILPELNETEQREISEMVSTLDDAETRRALRELLSRQRQLDKARKKSF
nr:DciA family protein [uncultured Desulfuromonas sp.]